MADVKTRPKGKNRASAPLQRYNKDIFHYNINSISKDSLNNKRE